MPMASLHEVRLKLLELHKALVEAERRGYERVHGRQSDTVFLEALEDGLTQQVPEILVAHGEVMRALRA
jgi:hypothetical protein